MYLTNQGWAPGHRGSRLPGATNQSQALGVGIIGGCMDKVVGPIAHATFLGTFSFSCARLKSTVTLEDPLAFVADGAGSSITILDDTEMHLLEFFQYGRKRNQ